MIALAVAIDSPGPIIYRSRRVGRGGKRFDMLKFRKMGSEASGSPLTLENDERFTRVGGFLARSRLDELPQVVNVLRGEMRLVGPRPELECFVADYPEQYARILTVTPGITGTAQLRFLDERALLRGPDPVGGYRKHVLPAKLEIDLTYARSRSFAGDLSILLRTAALPVLLLRGRGRAVRGALLTAVCAGLLTLAVAAGLLLPAAFGAAGTPASRRAVPKLIWGPVDLPNGRSAFPIYHRLGVDVFQVDLLWSRVARSQPARPTDPDDPAYHWPPQLDQAIAAGAHYRIRICLLVQSTPRWANGGRGSGWAPTDPADFGAFLIAASRRYPSVRFWMVWGEPNRNGNFEPMPANSPVGPRRYALVLAAAYRGLKQASRANVVIGGDTWSFGGVEPADFVKWMRLPDGRPPPLDLYGHNPFSIRFPDLALAPYYRGGRDIDDIDTLEAQLRQTYHRRVELWLSEFTVASDHPNRAFATAVSRAAQARWLTAAYALVNSVDYVAGLGWFNLIDQPPTVRGGLTQGLETWNLHPKPAFYAYERVR